MSYANSFQLYTNIYSILRIYDMLCNFVKSKNCKLNGLTATSHERISFVIQDLEMLWTAFFYFLNFKDANSKTGWTTPKPRQNLDFKDSFSPNLFK